MLDENVVTKLSEKLYQLRDARAESHPPAEDLNELIADLINGLEVLFVIINATAAEVSKPQPATFVSVSKPNEPKRL